MASLLIWAGVLLACFGAGAALLVRLRANAQTSAEEFPFAVGLGMGILAYLMLGAGLLGQLRAWLGITLVCLLALLGWRHLLRLGRHVIAALRTPKRWRLAALPLLLFFLCAAVTTLVGALAPATDLDYDGLVYHLAIPKIYLRDGAIHSIPWLSHSNFPFTLEMLYLLGLLLRDQTLAKLFHFGCGWLTICAIFAFGRRRWGPLAGWLGALIFAAIPLVAWEMMSAYNELAFAFYAFLAVSALARWAEGRTTAEGHGWLWVSAITCGLALGTKMLAGAVLIFAVIALAYTWVRLPRREGMAPRLLAFTVIAAAVAAPWYLKSYLWTGNPVYPFFYGLFDGRWWTAERARLYTEAQHAFGLGKGPLAYLALPWHLTMNPRWFFDLPQQLRPVNTIVWVFGPLLLALLPALVVTGPVGGGRVLLWFALIYAAIWFPMSQNGRYLIPILPGLSACAGLAAARLLERRGLLAAATALALLLGSTAALYASFGLAAPAIRVALGTQSQSDYLQTTSPLVYPMLDAVNDATPPDARILVLGDEPRLFYLDRDYLLGNHAEIFTRADVESAPALRAALARMRVTHLLLHTSTVRDMDAGVGVIETNLAALAASGEIRLLGLYGTLSLWHVADEGS